MKKIGRYDVVSLLGQGAMGAVYEVTFSGERLALKLLTASGPDVLERFRREARVLELVGRHANVVRLRDVGEHQGRPFLVMDLLGGGTLAERLAKGPVPERETAALLVGVARALHFAHEAGVVHRDVKPSNVLLDQKGQPFLGDFGIARDDQAHTLTETGILMGTIAYMSPEQASPGERPIDRRADVYGLGAILYEILAGERPFQGAEISVIKKILFERPRPPRSMKPGVDPGLEAIALRALAKDPALRQPTAEAFAQDLERCLLAERLPPVRGRTAVLLLALGVSVAACGALAVHGARLDAALAAERLALEKRATLTRELETDSPLAVKAVLDEAERLEKTPDGRDAAVALVERACERDGLQVLERRELSKLLRTAGSQELARQWGLADAKRDASSVRVGRRRVLLGRLIDRETPWPEEGELLKALADSARADVRHAARPWLILTRDEAGATSVFRGALDAARLARIEVVEAATWPAEWLAVRALVDDYCAHGQKAEFWTEALLSHPEASFVWANAGLSEREIGHGARSIRCLSRAADLVLTARDRGWILAHAAQAALELGRDDLARSFGTRALTETPGDDLATFSLAVALIRTGHASEAASLLDTLAGTPAAQKPVFWYLRAEAARLNHDEEAARSHTQLADRMIGRK